MKKTTFGIVVLAGCLVWAQSASAVIVRLTTPTTSVVEYNSIADVLTNTQDSNTAVGWDFITKEGDWFDFNGKIYRVHNGGSTPSGRTAIIEYADIAAVQADNQSSHVVTASGIDYVPQGSGWFDFGGSIWHLTSDGPTLPNQTRVIEYANVADVITDTQASSTDITTDLVTDDGAWFDFGGHIYRLFNGGSTPTGSTALVEYASIADVLIDNQTSHTIIGADYISNDTAWFDFDTVVPEPGTMILSISCLLSMVSMSVHKRRG